MPRKRHITADALEVIQQTCTACGQIFPVKRRQGRAPIPSDRWCPACILAKARAVKAERHA